MVKLYYDNTYELTTKATLTATYHNIVKHWMHVCLNAQQHLQCWSRYGPMPSMPIICESHKKHLDLTFSMMLFHQRLKV